MFWPGYGERLAFSQPRRSGCFGVATPSNRLILAAPRGTVGPLMRHHRPHPPERRQQRRSAWKRKGPRPAPKGESEQSGSGAAVLYGWHTVKAALENPARRIRHLYATANAARRLADEGMALAVEPEIVRPDAIARRLGPDAVHNGLLAEVEPLPARELEELEPAGIVLVLDQITDPHNVGAIARSAAAFAVAAIVITARHSPEATGVLAKAASGALEHVPLVTVQNLARALAALKERGYHVIGLDSSGATDFAAATIRPPLALVLGAEGKGLRHLTLASCDEVARLDVPGKIKSLNVSNAAALALYLASKRLASP